MAVLENLLKIAKLCLFFRFSLSYSSSNKVLDILCKPGDQFFLKKNMNRAFDLKKKY